MVTGSPEFTKKTLQIKQDDKFFSRIVSKESSLANPSFRVYYGDVSSAIPFTWEIQPGTPKHNISDNSLPPLTPPPSYSYYTINSQKPNKKNSSRYKLFNTLLLMFHLKKAQVITSSYSSSSSSSSSSWSSSSSSSSSNVYRSRRRFLSFGSLFDDGMDDGHVYGGSSSPTSVHCFGSGRRRKIE